MTSLRDMFWAILSAMTIAVAAISKDSSSTLNMPSLTVTSGQEFSVSSLTLTMPTS